MKRILVLLLSLFVALPAYGQSVAQPVLPGALTTSGCASGLTSCYKPYSSANPLPVTVGTSGSAASIYFSTAATNTPTAIKTSAGTVSWISFDNVNNASESCVQFFDLAAGSVTVGTTAPKFSVCSPANGYWDTALLAQINFSTAITYAVTTTRTGATAPGAAVTVRFGYN
jgi:hypothetical protein